jgi:hypothetical protein
MEFCHGHKVNDYSLRTAWNGCKTSVADFELNSSGHTNFTPIPSGALVKFYTVLELYLLVNWFLSIGANNP